MDLMDTGMKPSPLLMPDEHEVIIDINTTPLIDVLLVLLVMLIITIPIQYHAINLELPEGRPPISAAQPDKIRIDIDAQSLVYWQGQAVGMEAIEALMAKSADTNPQANIQVRADKNASYAVFAAVLAASKRQQLNRMAVVGAEHFAQ